MDASPVLTLKRAAAVVSLSAALAAGYFWYVRRRRGPKSSSKSKLSVKRRQLTPKSAQKSSSASKDDEKIVNQSGSTSDDEEWQNEEESGTDYTSDSFGEENHEVILKRRGHKSRPQYKLTHHTTVQPDRDRISVKSHCSQQQPSIQQQATTLNDPAIASMVTPPTSQSQPAPRAIERSSWADDVERAESSASSEAEITSAAMGRGSVTSVNDPRSQTAGSDNGGVSHQHHGQQYVPSPAVSSVKSQSADSPSLGSDLHSEASQDSGKGASMGVTSMSPVEELIEVPPVYEFEVPRDIVGLLIGKKGQTIKWLTEQSQAYIVIRDHFYSDKHKICTLEGTREQINKCLRLIRRKFPPSRFPELRLTPILPPPVPTPRTPVWDNVVQLNLPEGVHCEVALSSIVNIGHVFLQQPTHPTFSSLSRLDQYMLAVYGQPAGVPPLPRPIEMGVVCATPVLGGWYRAQTMDFYDDTDEALVKFVDYGGYSRVSASDLRQIRSDFMTLPFQATECYLSHIAPADEGEGWSSEAGSVFEQLCYGKVIEAKVTGHTPDNIPLVELYSSTQESKSVLINRLLVDRGFAVWTET